MVNKDFFLALDELEREKRIKKAVFIDALETALAIAYKRHTGTAKAVSVKMVPERNTIKITAFQTVVEIVEDKESQISLEDARLINKKYKVGDVVQEDVSSKDFGRIAAQTAKQVIMQKLREVESEIAYNDLTQKEDELVSCIVRRIEDGKVYVEINKLEAVLMPQDQAPTDRFNVGDRIKVYVRKIKAGHKGPQIFVSRSVSGFVKKLFEMEVPEIANGLVTIKSIVREPGYRTKIAVASEDKDIDPVGACVGNRGMRVNAIVNQLDGEKIDVIPWCEDALEFIARALSPAKVLLVQVNDEEKIAKAVVNDDMLSLAIGKDGQNARLAARLTGWKIDVRPYSVYKASLEEGDSIEEEDEDEASIALEADEGSLESVQPDINTIDDAFSDDLGDLE